MFKLGVQCLRCFRVFFDKSGFAKHHASVHEQEGPKMYETGVSYTDVGGCKTTEFDWTLDPLPVAAPAGHMVCPGLLERETKILSKAERLFSEKKWDLGDPSVGMQDEATDYIDAIDEAGWKASTLVRVQIMRSKAGAIKVVPFQPLKDTSGYGYAKTLSRFKLFAEAYFERDGTMQDIVLRALQEKCNSQDACCLESFVYWLTQHAPMFKNADHLQHAAMHMRRVLRGTALLHMIGNPDVEIESFCVDWLNPTKASPFGVLTALYYEIKRCVPNDKRLLIQRCDPDEGFPNGSAIMVDTGQELVRVSWSMMRSIISSTVAAIETALDSINLPGKDMDLTCVKDCEDPAIGAGILAQNYDMFTDKDQFEWLKANSKSFTQGRKIFDVLQQAARDFLAGIGANIGGGSRRMPELCCITIEVTAQNPIRSFRLFENEGVFVGDYRKAQGAMVNPGEDVTLWVIPSKLAKILCRLIIYGKPIEIRLAQKLIGEDAAIVHKTLFGAYEGKPLKSTKLGDLTNAALSAHGCPNVNPMRHVREHFSTELALEMASVADLETRQVSTHMFNIAATSSNHSSQTAKATYAGVFEKNSVGGLRLAEAREKMRFSRKFNEVVLGFSSHSHSQDATQPKGQIMPSPTYEGSQVLSQKSQGSVGALYPSSEQIPSSHRTPPTISRVTQCHHSQDFKYGEPLSPLASRYARSKSNVDTHGASGADCKRVRGIDFDFIAQRLSVGNIRPLQQTALELLLKAQSVDTKIIQAPTSMGKDLLPFALSVVTKKAQLVFVPFVALIENIIHEGSKFRCNVVKFSDVHKTIDIPTAAASADIIVCSYEHAGKAVRLAQELASRGRLGWCFFNEAHVIELDSSWRDFSSLSEICSHCPQVCCMSATIQPRYIDSLAAKLGRSGFSNSMLLCPERPELALKLKVTTDTRAWLAHDLSNQPAGQRAIVFCLFTKVVPELAAYLKGTLRSREVLQCTSGITADLAHFRRSTSAVMVCTSVLCTGVSIDNIWRVYFMGGAHGAEAFLQGAGRGARSGQEQCIATMVVSKKDMEYYHDSKLDGISGLAGFCQSCAAGALDFAKEIYKMFEHRQSPIQEVEHGPHSQVTAAAALDVAPGAKKFRTSAAALFPSNAQLFDLPRESLDCGVDKFKELIKAIMRSQKPLQRPDMSGHCDGCHGDCVSTSSCQFLHLLNDTAVRHSHCQACLMPLKRVLGENAHPSAPGWKQCEFKNRDHIRKYLVLASLGIDIKVALPATFPRTGPQDAMSWAFHASPASPPNIILFIAALLGLM